MQEQPNDDSDELLINRMGYYATRYQQFITEMQKDLCDRFFKETGYLIEFALNLDQVADWAGIYFLMTMDFKLSYIGQSQNIQKRLSGNHHVFEKGKYYIGYYIHADMYDFKQRRAAESMFIQALMPKLNKEFKDDEST